MSEENIKWTTDMIFPVGNGYEISDVANYIKESFEKSMDYSMLYDNLLSKFAITNIDAELALDRATGGIVRALTTNIENKPDEKEDPIANHLFNVVWESLPSKGLFNRKKIAAGYWYEWNRKRNQESF